MATLVNTCDRADNDVNLNLQKKKKTQGLWKNVYIAQDPQVFLKNGSFIQIYTVDSRYPVSCVWMLVWIFIMIISTCIKYLYIYMGVYIYIYYHPYHYTTLGLQGHQHQGPWLVPFGVLAPVASRLPTPHGAVRLGGDPRAPGDGETCEWYIKTYVEWLIFMVNVGEYIYIYILSKEVWMRNFRVTKF